MLRLFGLVLLLHVYVGMRLLPDLPLGAAGVAVAAVLLLASAVSMPLAMLSRQMPQPRADVLAWAGFVAMGNFSSLLVLTAVRDLVFLIGIAASLLWPLDAVLAAFLAWSAIGVPGLALLVSAAGFANARRRAALRAVDVPVRGLPAALHGFTIAQISDVHVGPTIKYDYLEAIVDAVNNLDADMVAVTGDLVDGSVRQLSRHVAPLSQLRARHGAFFVTGNHEYYSGVQAWVAEVGRLGLRVLQNEHVVLQHDGALLVVAGVSDFSAGHYDPAQTSDPVAALRGAPSDAAFRLLLAHQPRSAFAAVGAGYDLQVSGHTHGGQFLPWNLFVRLQQPFTSGLHRLGDMWVYTSRGTGYWGPPLRFGAPSEIMRLRLVPA
jgi:predicted MPP superfamily phosphohydrolase